MLYSSPPPAQTRTAINPTLLVSWWCTGFAFVIILVRLSGRYVRSEKLFREDKIMAASIIPLCTRMALVHVILIWGTNNAITTGMSSVEIHHRDIGSKLVLASRISYAAFIWTAKFTISEFLKRLIEGAWRRTYEFGLQFIRYFLLWTFVAVVVATLSGCRPFSHYWQVIPDPGPHCRQGIAQIMTMGASDVVTDLLLVGYPITIVMQSGLPKKRKFSLSLLFGLSSILIAITIYRVVATIDRHADQQFRSLLASIEILAAAAISNAVVLGSFVRDRGVKKKRYRYNSDEDNRSLTRQATPRRATTLATMHWGSDADLVGSLGVGIGSELMNQRSNTPRPAPMALPLSTQAHRITPNLSGTNWTFPRRESDETDESDIKLPGQNEDMPSPGEAPVSPLHRMSFFDVGGLLENGDVIPIRRLRTPSPPPPAVPTLPALSEAYILPPVRRGSHHLLQDIDGLLPPPSPRISTPISIPHPTYQAPMPRNFSRPSLSQTARPTLSRHTSEEDTPQGQDRTQTLQEILLSQPAPRQPVTRPVAHKPRKGELGKAEKGEGSGNFQDVGGLLG